MVGWAVTCNSISQAHLKQTMGSQTEHSENSKGESDKCKEIKENNLRGAAAPRRGAAGGSAFVFFNFSSIFVYFSNNPSHWDGNPGIGIVNPNNPKQSQLRQKPGLKPAVLVANPSEITLTSDY